MQVNEARRRSGARRAIKSIVVRITLDLRGKRDREGEPAGASNNHRAADLADERTDDAVSERPFAHVEHADPVIVDHHLNDVRAVPPEFGEKPCRSVLRKRMLDRLGDQPGDHDAERHREQSNLAC